MIRAQFSVIAIVLTASLAWAQGVGYQLRGERKFENEVDGHTCKGLFINKRAIAWVSGAVPTSIGLVARICKEEEPPFEGATSGGATYGGVIKGWHVFNLTSGNAVQLSLPELDEFSNPSFCGRFVAYWGVSGNSNYSLVVADLKTRVIVKKLPVGRLELETDYMYHLAPGVWDTGCTVATFSDQRYIKKTVIRAKSN